MTLPVMHAMEVDPERHIESVVQRVKAALADVEPGDVEGRVREAFAAWGEPPVKDFLPILVEREVVHGLRRERARLRLVHRA